MRYRRLISVYQATHLVALYCAPCSLSIYFARCLLLLAKGFDYVFIFTPMRTFTIIFLLFMCNFCLWQYRITNLACFAPYYIYLHTYGVHIWMDMIITLIDDQCCYYSLVLCQTHACLWGWVFRIFAWYIMRLCPGGRVRATRPLFNPSLCKYIIIHCCGVRAHESQSRLTLPDRKQRKSPPPIYIN